MEGVLIMMNEETRRKLRELSLEEIITILDQQDKDAAYTTLPFDDRIKMMVDYVYQEKYTGKVKRLIRGARFRIPSADVHDIYYVSRNIDRELMMNLSVCQFVSDNRNIVFQGFTGSGKRYMACALGKEACKQGIRTRYVRLPDLLMEREEKTQEPQGIPKLLKKYCGYTLLILDEWLIQVPSDDELRFLFELIERRYDEGATIFCTQFRKEDWHTRLGGGILADSILDRMIHRMITVYAGDINMREFLTVHDL
jgi:DNA replication protein DnaC